MTRTEPVPEPVLNGSKRFRSCDTFFARLKHALSEFDIQKCIWAEPVPEPVLNGSGHVTPRFARLNAALPEFLL